MALEMQLALANGLQFKDAYVHIGSVSVKRGNKTVLDEDGNPMRVDPADKSKGFKTKPVWKAVVNVRVFKSKSVREQGMKALEKRSEMYEIDIDRPVMAQVYAAMKKTERYEGAQDA